MPILIILFIGGLLLYAVIPVTIDFVNLQYTGKSTLLQMWGHFILSKEKKKRTLKKYKLFKSAARSGCGFTRSVGIDGRLFLLYIRKRTDEAGSGRILPAVWGKG